MATDRSKSRGWATLLPEFFYDLISRVPPGMMVVLLFLGILGAFDEGGIFELPAVLEKIGVGAATILFALLVGAGFTLGLPLSVFGYKFQGAFYTRVWERIIERYPEVFPDDGGSGGLGLKGLSGRKRYSKAYESLRDYLKVKHPETADILTKLSAESSLCMNLAAASLIYFVAFSLLLLLSEPSVRYGVFAGSALFGVGFFTWTGSVRYRRLLIRLVSLYKIATQSPPDE